MNELTIKNIETNKKHKKNYLCMRIRQIAFSFFCVVFVITVNICVFAAVVSDNDGSAFITKAEFDSLNNAFQSQLNQFNTQIDSKIDTAIAGYLSGVKAGRTDMLTNNLETLQKNYNVYWSGQTNGLATTRVPYGTEWQINIGGRGSGYGSSNTRCAQGTYKVDGSFVRFPIITEEKVTTSSGTITRYIINYWEERKPWLTYCGFFLFNGDYWNTWPQGDIINGVFATQNMNPNTNDIFAMEDSWWNPGNGTGGNSSPWAMSIWAVYSTMSQNKDTKSIYIYSNAGSTYCWNESDTRKSTGSGGGGNVTATNNGSWANGGGASTYTGSIVFSGYTSQSNAYFPWCHKQYTYSNLYDDRIRTITGATAPISDGLLLTSDKGPGKLRITANGSSSGNVSIIVKDGTNKNTIKTVNDTINTADKQINVDLTNLEENKNFNVWIKYTPSSQSTLNVGNIYYERKE